MTTKSIKLIVFIALLVHGIGHLQGVVASLGVKFHKSSSTSSWLLKSLGESANRMICLALYLGTSVTGILTALLFFEVIIPDGNWEMPALITAILSTMSLVLYPRTLAMFFNKAGAVVVNLWIYYTVLLEGNWPSQILQD